MDRAKQLLLALASDDNAARKQAEIVLDKHETNPGFISSLFQIICTPSSNAGQDGAVGAQESLLQEMAAVIFSRVVRRHWVCGPDDPVVFSEETKHKVRGSVLKAAFGATNVKLRTSLAVVVGHIAQIDYPDRWPALIPALFSVLTSDALRGGGGGAGYQAALSGLRCLTIIAEDICDETLFKLMPYAMPRLLAVAQSPSSSVGIAARKDVVRIAASFLHGLSTLVRHHSKDVKKTLGGSSLPGWLSFSNSTLKAPVSPQLAGLKRLALAFHDTLLAGYGKLLAPENVCDMVVSELHNLRLYAPVLSRSLAVHDIDPPNDGADDRLAVEPIAVATFGCLRRVAASKKHRGALTQRQLGSIVGAPPPGDSTLAAVLAFLLRFAQASAEQVQRWEDDPDAFNVDEDIATQATELEAGGGACPSTVVRTVLVDFLYTVLEQYRGKVAVKGVSRGTWHVGSAALADAVTALLRSRHAAADAATSGGGGGGGSPGVGSPGVGGGGGGWQLEEVALKAASLLQETLQYQQDDHSQQKRDSGASLVGRAAPLLVEQLFQSAVRQISAFFSVVSSPSKAAAAAAAAPPLPHQVPSPGPTISPFLVARYFWLCSDLSNALTDVLRAKFVVPCQLAMQPAHPQCLRLCAVRLVYTLANRVVRARRAAKKAAEKARRAGQAPPPPPPQGHSASGDNEALRKHLATLLQSTFGVLGAVGEDNVHVCIETLGMLLQVDPSASGITARAAAGLIPPLLKLWAANVNHPMNGNCLMDVFRRFAKVPACLPDLLKSLTPVIGRVIGSTTAAGGGYETTHNSSVVQGCVDLLHVLLCAHGALCQACTSASSSASSNDAAGTAPTLDVAALQRMARETFASLLKAFGPVLHLTMHTDDQVVLHSCWDVLRAYVRLAHPSQIAAWRDTGGGGGGGALLAESVRGGDGSPAAMTGIVALSQACARFLQLRAFDPSHGLEGGSASSPSGSAAAASSSPFKVGVWNDAALGQLGHGIGGLCARVMVLLRTEPYHADAAHAARFRRLAHMVLERLMVTRLTTLKAALLRPFATVLVGGGSGFGGAGSKVRLLTASELLRGVLSGVALHTPPPSQFTSRKTRRSQQAAASSAPSGASAMHRSAVSVLLQSWIDALQDSYFTPYVLKLLAKGALALCEGDAPEIVDGVRVWVSGPDSGGYGAAGTGTAVSFRTAAYYVVLNQIAEQQLDADGAGSDEEDSYDFDDSESDDDHDGASGDEGGGGVGHGEGFLLSDVAMMGGMGALYGDEESDDEDDESELGDGLVEDNEDDKADNPGASELLDFSSTVAGIIQSVGPRPELRTAMGMLPAHRQERVRKFLTGGGAGRK